MADSRTLLQGVVLPFLLMLGAACSCAADRDSPLLTDEQLQAELAGADGLCVHLGSTDGALESAAARSGRMLVHGLAGDEASLTKARACIERNNLYGLASMVLFTGKGPLPYREHLVDRLVISRAEALTGQGLTQEEILRVLAPGGAAYLGGKAGWKRMDKPRPTAMDDWPTRQNRARGGLISKDVALKAPFELRWVDGTTLGLYGENATLCSARGRYFARTVWDAGNVGGTQQTMLVARNAFNGLPLWRKPAAIDARGICVVEDTVFVPGAQGKEILGLDAATGEQRCTIACPANSLAGWGAAGDALVMAQGDVKRQTNRSLVCVDGSTGSQRWRFDGGTWPFLIAGDAVYTVADKLVCLDARTGKPRWQAVPPPIDVAGKEPVKVACCFAEGAALVVATKEHLAAYSTRDGAALWSSHLPPTKENGNAGVMQQAPYPWKGAVALGRILYDLSTGRELGLAPPPFAGRCMPRVATPEYVIANHHHGSLGLLSGADLKDIVDFQGMDSICGVGLMVANGMMYSGPSFCACIKGKIEGFPAFGSAGVRIDPKDMVAPRPVVAGPGRGKPFAAAPAEEAWPMYRHDAQRSAGTAVAAPRRLALRWERKLSTLPSGVIAAGWASRVSLGLTAPTVADGRVFVADAETHRVLALSAKDGRILWTFRADGRVDTPPTLHAGRCLFGGRDGWVYCLRADDGQLVWRARAAPAEQNVISFGQVESAWPVAGSVAVQGDLVCLAAGRSYGVDGGVPFLAFRIEDGSLAWAHNRGYVNDMPIGDGSALYIGGIKVCDEDLPKPARPGQPSGPLANTQLLRQKDIDKVPFLIGPRAGLADAGMMLIPPWGMHRGQSRSHAFQFHGRSGLLIGFDATDIFVYGIANWDWVGRKPDFTPDLVRHRRDPNASAAAAPAWSAAQPTGTRIHGIAVARDGLVVCGTVNVFDKPWRGFVRVHSRDDAASKQEYEFAGSPNWDPMALVQGSLFLSTADGRLICLGE